MMYQGRGKHLRGASEMGSVSPQSCIYLWISCSSLHVNELLLYGNFCNKTLLYKVKSSSMNKSLSFINLPINFARTESLPNAQKW